MPNVAGVRLSDWNKDGTIVKVTNVTFDDGSEAPGYDLPQELEIGKPLPDGWEVAQGKSGKPYIKYPKAGKGAPQAAFRNTKEGQAAEQRSIHASVALTQAVAMHAAHGISTDGREATRHADVFFAWLTSKTSGAAVPTSPTASVTSAPEKSNGETTAGTVGTGAGADRGQVASPGEAGAACSHPSFKRVNGQTVCTKCGWVRA